MDVWMCAKHQEGNNFDPYENNSGTTVVIKQQDCIIIGGDTRHSSEMGINSRTMSKIFMVGDFVMTTSGFYADGYEVFTRMRYHIKMYESQNRRKISVASAAHLLHNILYSRRFFPYYSFITLSGFGETPVVYRYDPVGSYESTDCDCSGSSASLIQPILDSVVSKKNWANCMAQDLGEKESINVVKMAFEAATERDVNTGDYLEVFIVRHGEIKKKMFDLRKD